MLEAMRRQQHRGPDGSGLLHEEVGDRTISLAHQRLAIIDLSNAARQPMESHSGDCVLIFNGEIYNYREMRDGLRARGVEFRTESDSEVLLQALEFDGVERTHKALNGMWAFVLLNRRTRTLLVSRDRFGVKPLYYYLDSSRLYLASEIKVLLQLVGRRLNVNAALVERFLAQSQVDYDNDTFFESIYKVPAGHYAQIDLSRPILSLGFTRYWRMDLEDSPSVPLSSIIEQTRSLLDDAVRIRLRSDVRVGALVSGGIDSSAIAGIMQCNLAGGENLNLFGAVSGDPRFDESRYMDAVARHLGKEVHKVQLEFSPESTMELIEKSLWHNDEPFGNFTPVATYLLMKRARDLGITVILSGQGADEAFCGYLKYVGFHLQSEMRSGRLVGVMRSLFDFWRQGTVLNQFNYADAKRYLAAGFRGRDVDVRGPALRGLAALDLGLGASNDVRRRQVLDIERFSIPVLTHWEDRMSMAWSREIRNPFLDYRLVEVAVRAPTNFKLMRGWTKYPLRRAVEDVLPPEVTWRRDKMGFTTPIGEWLKNDLEGNVRDCLAPDSHVVRSGMLNHSRLMSVFETYRRQAPERGRIRFTEIWNPMVLEMWWRVFQEHLVSN